MHMNTDTNPFNRSSMVRACALRFIYLAFPLLHAAPLVLFTTAMAVLVIGVFCVEVLFTSWPSIPQPVEQIAQPTQLPTLTSELETVPLVQIFLHPQDIKPLALTLKQDVIRHGGAVIRGSDESRRWTFAVSQQYLTRIQPLVDASGVRPPGKSYRQWARYVYANPKDSKITGPANVAVTFQFIHPLFLSAATMWATIAAAIMAGCAILIMTVIYIFSWLLPRRYEQAIRSAKRSNQQILKTDFVQRLVHRLNSQS